MCILIIQGTSLQAVRKRLLCITRLCIKRNRRADQNQTHNRLKEDTKQTKLLKSRRRLKYKLIQNGMIFMTLILYNFLKLVNQIINYLKKKFTPFSFRVHTPLCKLRPTLYIICLIDEINYTLYCKCRGSVIMNKATGHVKISENRLRVLFLSKVCLLLNFTLNVYEI